ncbi:MAG: DUF364 domain-containing protein [Gammaproteobacteria bacterium]|nr:DUF364 domain-containing protein [Gammaproteobacteria bacterium]
MPLNLDPEQSSNSLSASLLALCGDVASAMPLPAVDHIYLPPPQVAGEKSRKFGLVVLEDRSTGFFFTLLGDERGDAQVPKRHPRDVLELAAWFASDDIHLRAVGLGAIGAVTQALFKAAGYRPPDAVNPVANLDPGPGDHVGMVGYFPGLVDRLRANGVRLTVLELDEKWVQQGERFEVTVDPSRLAQCNKVLCTASTLINDTVDDILRAARHADYVALIGPSAGCLPDPLFDRGVHLVGGSSVVDYEALEAACDSGEDWRGAVVKYCISPADYPGTAALLDRIR